MGQSGGLPLKWRIMQIMQVTVLLPTIGVIQVTEVVGI